MPAPKNRFKQALREGRAQIGLWQALANPYTVEICAGAGYDWLLLDAEHAPNDVPLLVSQLQAMKGTASHAVIRPPIGETWIVKQLLDIGAQTLLIPMVDSKAMAETMVRAVRYPPHGLRGVGAALARASAFSRTADYLQTANDEVCLLLQIESCAGLQALEDIAGTEGVDGVFVGPADLAADMGFLGDPGAPEVQAEVEKALLRIQQFGKAAGILTGDLSLAKHYLELGATFVAIGNDVTLLANATSQLLRDFQKVEPSEGARGAGVY
ncbi:2,4-dihydroxyhept-2-ene-1,7-dioic acid aldolase (plasmid) [Sinorhizobium sojae CCBAU 05684]|uniref:2,4-dihydroxyhept-2-ene-1,7-dioic acid aldolase n=1 Tax=Sinorhizobium sojae CCBAU 05684 TaxID=716928 RepID=A0A249PK29_9HYPH|nr:4-hydroxy-2-oxoheptanedioate aldolase [Sinorhizobium sojae]ASY66102.1 2,4-dihydroxyhept-2-ene-1,7-dioic acid aldolase [Sinorhizobium sojae CCBAU 05684]